MLSAPIFRIFFKLFRRFFYFLPEEPTVPLTSLYDLPEEQEERGTYLFQLKLMLIYLHQNSHLFREPTVPLTSLYDLPEEQEERGTYLFQLKLMLKNLHQNSHRFREPTVPLTSLYD